MLDITNEFLLLKAVLIKKKYFGESLYEIFSTQNISFKEKERVRKDSSNILYHYFSLSFEEMNLFKDYEKNSEEMILNIIALYHLRNKDDIKDSYVSLFNKNILNGDSNLNYDILLKASLTSFKIPEEVKQNPYLYNSLSLEFPEFLLKDLKRDFSAQEAINIALALKKKSNTFYCVNTLKSKIEDYLVDKRFEAICFRDKYFLLSLKKGSLKPIDDLKEGKLYETTLLNFKPYSSVFLDAICPKVLLLNSHNMNSGVYFDLLFENYLKCEVTPCFSNNQSYKMCLKNQKNLSLTKITPLYSDLKLVKTYKIMKDYDLVCLNSKDTHIGQSQTHVGILPSLEEDDIKKSYLIQINDLEEANYFVKDNGYLLFLNYSLIREETTDVINTFIERHPYYQIIEKSFVLPQTYSSDAGFYCLLKRIKK